MEWIIGNRVPHIDGATFQVQTIGDQVREVRRNPERDWTALWFTDCDHPAQNAICNEENIKAWRQYVMEKK